MVALATYLTQGAAHPTICLQIWPVYYPPDIIDLNLTARATIAQLLPARPPMASNRVYPAKASASPSLTTALSVAQQFSRL